MIVDQLPDKNWTRQYWRPGVEAGLAGLVWNRKSFRRSSTVEAQTKRRHW
jgi:hypothetical protein